MNLLEILRRRVDSLTVGDHTPGLRAVVQHVHVAVAHLERGQQSSDETAFTDAIYRANQAFEGSLKEAYRVLAGKAPEKVRPFDIETFFQEKAALRPRVLSQFTRYRQEWRNPSTHDYRLDFDEDEALLAIVSVSAFAIVLVDQMSEMLNFEHARNAASPIQPAPDPSRSLAEQVAEALLKFRFVPAPRVVEGPPRETEIIGALWGYLSSALPGLQVAAEALLATGSPLRADLLVSLEDRRLVIEVKHHRPSRGWLNQVVGQVRQYMQLAQLPEAVLYLYEDAASQNPIRGDHTFADGGGRVIVVGPPSLPEPA